MPLSSLLWVFLVFTFSGREASKHGCQCSGWKACTQARGASQGLGEERRTGEKQTSMISIFCLWILNNSYTILFTASSLFSDFFFSPQHLVWPRKLLKTSQLYPAKWGSQSPWIVGMKQVIGVITTFFGTSNFPMDRWLTLLNSIQNMVMQGMATIL